MDKSICAVEGCEHRAWARGWCSTHYGRWRKSGSPDPRPARDTVACSVDECARPAAARGWCRLHYGRWLRIGTTEITPPLSVEQRFWSKVDKGGPIPERRPDLGPCWLWTGWIDPESGYALWTYTDGDGRKVSTTAHAFAYKDTYGSPPEGLHHDHLCHVRPCCRPTHLEAVTQAENNRRSPKVARRTECKRGHSYAEHGYAYPSGKVCCRTCNVAAKAAWRERQRKTG